MQKKKKKWTLPLDCPCLQSAYQENEAGQADGSADHDFGSVEPGTQSIPVEQTHLL